MENLKRAADLLLAVLGDLDRIPVEGLDNQRTYLGCADGIETVRRVILQHTETAPVKKNTDTEEEANGR